MNDKTPEGGPTVQKVKIVEIAKNSRFPPEIQAQRLKAVIENELTDTQREAIELVFFEGLNYRGAAARKGVAVSSIWKATQRALRRIQRCLRY